MSRRGVSAAPRAMTGIGHADDGRGVPATAELGENGSIGTESTMDGFGENGAEMFFVFSLSAVTDFVPWIEIPIFAHFVFSASEKHE